MSDWLEELAIEAFNEHAMAGLAVGVVREGGLERFVGLGLADAEANRPVAPDTVFRVGSISKTMTAVAVMQLVEEGRLGLEDSVGEHLRSLRLEPREVTVRHLLTHTAGIGELRGWSDLARPVAGLASKVGEPLPSAAKYYARGLRAEVEPGSKWAYANHGFAALGALVEDLRGEPFPQVMRRRVFDPLGMEHSSFERDARVAGRLAVGYALRGARMKPVKDYEIAVGPAGACFSSTDDMARYVAALAGGGEPLLAPGSLARMLEPDATVPLMGLAFFLDRLDGHRLAGHDGGWNGFVSAMKFAPDDGVGVVVFTNTTVAFAPHALADAVLRRLLELGEARPPVVAQRPHRWRELTGLYKPARGLNTNLRWWPLIGGEVEVAVRKGRLVVRAPSPVKWLRRGIPLTPADPADELSFEARHEDWVVPVVFERGEGGKVESLHSGSARGGFIRLHRRPKATSLRLWGRGLAAGGLIAAATASAKMLRRTDPAPPKARRKLVRRHDPASPQPRRKLVRRHDPAPPQPRRKLVR